nr:phage protein Gp27 family protein [uncultured Desulfuromonas sp.]
MLAQTSIHRLPIDIVIEVKKRLRARSSKQIEITKWLNDLGYDISNSSLNRYALKLEKEDKALGVDRELFASKDADIMALFEELSEIRAREAEIIALLQSAMIPTKESQ